jgi:hypothetical protein
MAYTILDAQTRLAQRLGESNAPSVDVESTKRRRWFREALEVIFSKRPFWFLQDILGVVSEENQPYYDLGDDTRREIQVFVDGYKYEKLQMDELEDYRSSLSSVGYRVPDRSYFVIGNQIVVSPIPTSSPDVISVSAITRTGDIATVSATDHGFKSSDIVTISGADQDEYNGQHRIRYIDDDSFSYSVASEPTTPATGTITAQKNNIEIWRIRIPELPNTNNDSIVIPDRYINAIVSYGEGRYWSSAHKRAKASDAFIEFETIVGDMIREDIRRSFYTGDRLYRR